MVNVEEPSPVQAYYGEDGTELDDECEGMDESITLLYTHKVLCDDHVSCRGHRKEFCQSFDDGDDDGL